MRKLLTDKILLIYILYLFLKKNTDVLEMFYFCPYVSLLLRTLLTFNKPIGSSQSSEHNNRCGPYILPWIELKGMHLNHYFYVVVRKQCRTENA